MERETRLAATSLVLLACMLLPASAIARDPMGGTMPRGESYASFQLGAVSAGGNSTWSAAGHYGLYILNNIALEGSVGYYSEDRPFGELSVPYNFIETSLFGADQDLDGGETSLTLGLRF